MRQQAAKSFTDGLGTWARNEEANFPYLARHPEVSTFEGVRVLH